MFSHLSSIGLYTHTHTTTGLIRFGDSGFPPLPVTGLSMNETPTLADRKAALRMDYYAAKTAHSEGMAAYLQSVGLPDTPDSYVARKLAVSEAHPDNPVRTYRLILSDVKGPVGFLKLGESNSYDGEKFHPNVGKFSIVIRPDMLDKGLERWLVSMALRKAKTFGFSDLVSWVDVKSPEQTALSSLGFKRVEPGIRYKGTFMLSKKVGMPRPV